jgi:hypothetical protein
VTLDPVSVLTAAAGLTVALELFIVSIFANTAPLTRIADNAPVAVRCER